MQEKRAGAWKIGVINVFFVCVVVSLPPSLVRVHSQGIDLQPYAVYTHINPHMHICINVHIYEYMICVQFFL